MEEETRLELNVIQSDRSRNGEQRTRKYEADLLSVRKSIACKWQTWKSTALRYQMALWDIDIKF